MSFLAHFVHGHGQSKDRNFQLVPRNKVQLIIFLTSKVLPLFLLSVFFLLFLAS